MTNLKISSKMHIFIIISAAIVAIGIAVGLICQFVADGYFNYGNDYKSYNSVEVNYAYVDYDDEEEVKKLCDKVFDNKKVNYYSCTYGETAQGGTLEFKFSKGADKDKLSEAAQAITADLGSELGLSSAVYHSADTKLGGSKALKLGAIALAAAVAFQFIYFIIRFKLAMALSALLADVHNLALFLSLLTITRIPVGSSIFAFSALTVILTMIGCVFYFDRVRKNMKNELTAKLDPPELCDLSMRESLQNVCVASVGIAAAAVLVFVLLSISALSVVGVLSAVLSAVCGAAVSVYGTSFFTPSVYSRFKRIGDDFKAKHSKKAPKKA